MLLVFGFLAALAHPVFSSSDNEFAKIDPVFLVSSMGASGHQSDWASSLLTTESGGILAMSGRNPGGNANDKSDVLRSLGNTLFFPMLGLICFLLIFRGWEIRRQHPRPFH